MRKFIILLVVGLAGVAFYAVFLHIPVCVSAAAHRNHLLSQVGLCPPFVDISLEQIRVQFKQNIKSGEGEKQNIENTLKDLGIEYSWDKFSSRYQGIIRNPDSNFHAVEMSYCQIWCLA